MPVAIDRKKIAISEITIKDRQRKTMDPDHINGLQSSIRAIGLINPITLERGSNVLLAGFSRLTAVINLGWKEVDFLYQDELDEVDRQRIELEENLHRKDLEWWEKDRALARIHELMGSITAKENEGKTEAEKKSWTQKDTASLTGKGVGSVNRAIEVAQALKENPELKKEKTRDSALRKVKTEKKIVERKAAIERKNSGQIPTVPAQIVVGDALELIKQEPSEEYDAVVTNFPFGIEYQTKDGEELYEDDEDYIVKLVRAVTQEAFRVLKNDSWMVAFFDMRKITYSNKQRQFVEESLRVMDQLHRAGAMDHEKHIKMWELGMESLGLARWMEEAGFSYVTLMPLIWAKPNKTQGMIGNPNKGFIVAYEAFVFASKGDAVLMKQGKQNIIIHDTLTPSEREFGMQMPIPVCKQIIEMVTLGGGKVLDPFAGVGSFGEGSLDHFCSFKGFELNPERAEVGNLRLQEHIYARTAAAQQEKK